jgi:hypothetical protein
VVDLMAVLVARGSYDRFCEVLATVDANEGLDNIKRLFVPKLEKNVKNISQIICVL